MGKIKGKKRANKPKKEIKRVNLGPKTRKDIRKEKRNAKKINKKEYFSKTTKEIGKFVKAPSNIENEEKEQEIIPHQKNYKKSNAKLNPKNPVVSNMIIEENKGAKKREEKLKYQMKEKRNSQLLKANEDEEKMIKKLEKQLHLKKKKSGNISKSFAADGLGYLLEVCDERTMQAAVAAEKHLAETGSGSDFEEDIAIATGKSSGGSLKTSKMKKNKKQCDESSTESSDYDFSEDDEFGDFSDDENEEESFEDNDHIQVTKSKHKKSEKNKMLNSHSSKCKSKDMRQMINMESDDEISLDEDEPVDPKESSIKKTVIKKFADSPFPKCKNGILGQKLGTEKLAKKKIPFKQLQLPEDDIDNSSDMNSDEEIEEEELSEDMECSEEDEMRDIYTRISGFPDESFVPGDLSPVREETDYDLELYQKGIEETLALPKNSKNCCDKDGSSSDLEEVNEEEMEYDSLEDSDDEMLDDENPEDFPDSDDSDCCKEDSESNEQIIVNGKVINTYGRNFEREAEPEIIKCPEMDKLLENLSSTESDLETSFEKIKVKKKEKISPKGVLKRKVEDNDLIPKVAKKQKKNDNTKKKEKSKTCISKKVESLDEESENEECEVQKLDSDIASEASDKENTSESDSLSEGNNSNEKLWEDIYGRQRDQKGNIVTNQTSKYIPPHLRAKKDMEDSKEIQLLKRQIKGLLNKVAASNMHWTGSQLEGLYSSNSRHSVNNAFCSLWLASLVQSTMSSDRLAAEHTMLVAILHANVGSEVGAHFLQTVAKKFEEMVSVEQALEDKHLDNLILTIAHLYSFKIFQASLLYEILNKLLEKLSEKSVECTLVALRSVGGVLRKEDPSSLKTFIQTTQERASKLSDKSGKGSRVKFLLDVLLAIKNNNMNKIPNYDPSYTEELKKAMKGIIRKGNYIVPLNIKLDDLLKADERGKWWVVGSAWEGSAKEEKGESSGSKKPEDKKHNQLMELALQQRINTELRRNIFCIIMGAEDYMDAFEKLQQLGLKNQQEREIIHIIIACCLQEKTYNPYYSVLAQKYCDFDRKFQMSIQYSVWDKLKEIDTCPPFQIANLGQFVTHLFIEKGLPISILKVVQFADLTKASVRLMRQILLTILLHKRWQTCLEVFQRVAVSPKLRLFREGLRLFIDHFLVKNFDKKKGALSQEQMALLQERASAVDKTLNTDSKLKF